MAAYPEREQVTFYGPFNPWSLLPIFIERKEIIRMMEENPNLELGDYLVELEYGLGWRE